MSAVDPPLIHTKFSSSKTADSARSVRPTASQYALDRVIEAAAVWHHPFTDHTIASLLRIPVRGARIQIRKLIDRGVFQLVRGEGEYEFSESSRKSGIYQGIPIEHRRELHHRAALVLRKQDNPSRLPQPIMVFHLAESEETIESRILIHAIRTSIEMADDEIAEKLCDLAAHSQMVALESLLCRIELACEHGDERQARKLICKVKRYGNFCAEQQFRLTFFRLGMLRLNHSSEQLPDRLVRWLSYPGDSPIRIAAELHLLSFYLDARHFSISRRLILDLDNKAARIDWPEFRSHLLFESIRFKILTNDLETASKLLKTALNQERSGWRRVVIARLFELLGMLHYLESSPGRGLRTTLYALRMIEGCRRPITHYSIRMSRMKMMRDQGAFSDAERELSWIEKSFDTLPFIPRAATMVARFILHTRKNGRPEHQSRQWALIERITRHAWPVYLDLFREFAVRVSTVVPEVIERQENADARSAIAKLIGSVNSEKMAQDSDDAAAQLIRAFQVPTSDAATEISAGELIASTRSLSHPDVRHLTVDCGLEWILRQRDLAEHEGGIIHEMILMRALTIARQLHDRERIHRAERVTGILMAQMLNQQSSQNGASESELLDSILRCNTEDELLKMLECVGGAIVGSKRGLLVELDSEKTSVLFQWGNQPTVPEFRLLVKRIFSMYRKAEEWSVISAGAIALTLHLVNRQPSVAVFLECDRDRLMAPMLNRIRRLLAVIRLRWETQQNEPIRYATTGPLTSPMDQLIGHSSEIMKLKRRMDRIVRSDSTVHLHGETGTGKEMVAKLLHAMSPRKNKPFIAFNCGAMPENLVESELFGHVRGAFTGADSIRQGLFASAEGGTIFLDEVADLSPVTQAKLLRVLQERVIRPLGSDKDRPVNVRIISAANRPLWEDVRSGRFRSDLFYRLVVLELTVPPLRCRTGDIPLLASYFLDRFSNRLGVSIRGFSRGAMDLLCAHRWPGNVRELENTIEASIQYATIGKPIQRATIEEVLKHDSDVRVRNLGERLAEVERQIILDALTVELGNVSKTAQRLGISRQGLFQKMKRYDIINTGRRKNIHGSV